MIEVQEEIPPLSQDPQNALRQIEEHLRRMQLEIYQLRNLPLQTREISGYHVEDGILIWD